MSPKYPFVRKSGYEWKHYTGIDPKEKQNLAEDEKNVDVKARLKKRFEELAKKYEQ